MTSKDLQPNEYNTYYQTYIDKTNGVPLKEGLQHNYEAVVAFLKSIPTEKLEYRYAEGKWTIKEIVQHLIDTERIFTYRALRIARKDITAMPGYDQDVYAPLSNANARSYEKLLVEYYIVRQATIALFESFTKEMLMEIGTASNSSLSVRAVGLITIGHENHHCEVIKERYL